MNFSGIALINAAKEVVSRVQTKAEETFHSLPSVLSESDRQEIYIALNAALRNSSALKALAKISLIEGKDTDKEAQIEYLYRNLNSSIGKALTILRDSKND